MDFLSKRLESLLHKSFKPYCNSYASGSWRKIEDKGLAGQVREVYAALGGRHEKGSDKIAVSFPDWTIELEGFVVELDGLLHFNRYRAATLTAEVYEGCKSFDPAKYRLYCRKNESECLKSSAGPNAWSSPLTEKKFGTADEYGFLDVNGSPVWKQRAFDDFLKDLWAKHSGVKLLRVSVWDEVMVAGQLHKVKDALAGDFPERQNAVLKMMERRAAGLLG